MALSQSDVDDVIVNIKALNEWMEGDSSFIATFSNGRQVPSPSKAIADGQIYKGPVIAWPPGGTVTDALQLYSDGGLTFSPIESALPFSGTGAFPSANMRLATGYRPISDFDEKFNTDLTTSFQNVGSVGVSGSPIVSGSRLICIFSCHFVNTGTVNSADYTLQFLMTPTHTTTPVDTSLIVSSKDAASFFQSATFIGSFDAQNGLNTVNVTAKLSADLGGTNARLIYSNLIIGAEISNV